MSWLFAARPPVIRSAPFAGVQRMSTLRDVIAGPWRAVLVLGVTQILAWGTIFYTPVLTVPLIAADRGWSMTFAMGGFSLALLTAGLVSPRVGLLIDRYGGHRVMPVGSMLAALGLAAAGSCRASRRLSRGLDAASASPSPRRSTIPPSPRSGRIFGAAARRPITALTLAGGFASTVSWPATHLLLEAVGWRGTYLVYAALLAFVAAPLHAFALPRIACRSGGATARTGACADRRAAAEADLAFVLVAAAFAAYAFVPSGLSAHLLAIFGRCRHRCGDRGHDRCIVRSRAGRRAHRRAPIRAPCPSARCRALRRRHVDRRFRFARAARALGRGRRHLRGDVRNGQRPHHHRARRSAARAVRCCRIRPSRGADRRSHSC